jgi:hypothetical protein
MGGVAAAGAAGMAGMAAGAAMRRPERGPPPMYPPQEGNLPPDQFDAQTRDFQRTPYTVYGARQQSPAGGPRSQSVPYQPTQPSPNASLRTQSPYSMRHTPLAGQFSGAESPPPLPSDARAINSGGEAVEIDGSIGRSMATGYGLPANDLRGNDPDVRGMVGLQENRAAYTSNQQESQSPTSVYPPEEYAFLTFQGFGREANTSQICSTTSELDSQWRSNDWSACS